MLIQFDYTAFITYNKPNQLFMIQLLKSSLTAMLLLLAFFGYAQEKNPKLIIGTYTNNGSHGMYSYTFSDDASSDVLDSLKMSNPSYLAVAKDKQIIYAVNENNPGAVAAISINKINGKLILINTQTTTGANPCYISVTNNGKHVYVANYRSGSLQGIATNANGALGLVQQTIIDTGSGINKARQEKPHVHAAVLSKDNRFLYATDLGTDELYIYSLNAKSGMLSPAKKQPVVKLTAGAGPRHIAFHPATNAAYVIEELSGTVAVFKVNTGNGMLKMQQRISTLPTGFKGVIGSADIHVSPNGKFLYASNRGSSNSIAIFSIQPKTGKLVYVAEQSTLGKTPRNFSIDPTGKFLLAANQSSDEIVIFKIDENTGLLSDTGKRINVKRPVCLKWLN